MEAALALFSLVLVLALALSGLAAVGAQLRCQDAAREAARLTARGEPDRARAAAETIAPSGASVEVAVRGDEVTVTVAARGVGRLPGLRVSGRAVGVIEPGALLDLAAGAPTDPVADAPPGPSVGPSVGPPAGPPAGPAKGPPAGPP